MCDMTNCGADAQRYVLIKAEPAHKRLELCLPHVEMAHQLAAADLTHIIEYGTLGGGPRWRIK